MLKVIVLILALFTIAVGQDNLSYDCPRGDRVLPASCLEEMKIKDVSRTLNVKERHQVAYLFAKSYIVTIVRYKQDYYVKPNAPIVLLVTGNFPELKSLRFAEGGFWLGSVFEFFRGRSEYESDIQRAMVGVSKSKRRQFAK